jgi:hypothetical protein
VVSITIVKRAQDSDAVREAYEDRFALAGCAFVVVIGAVCVVFMFIGMGAVFGWFKI